MTLLEPDHAVHEYQGDMREELNGFEKVGGCGPLDGLEVGYQGQGMILRHLPKSP